MTRAKPFVQTLLFAKKLILDTNGIEANDWFDEFMKTTVIFAV